ncbi:MAG: hypothetical protein E7604_05025 [Ruminococcaceae bacterium]|nr:hypothetical protein [Oscillospiraceae bacterium]
MKKNTTLFLLAAMLSASVLTASCGGSDGGQTADDTADTGTEAPVETEPLDPRQLISDDLPEKDYSGKTFRMLLREGYEYEFDIEEADGDTMNDAIFNRNLKISERYGVDYETTAVSAVWNEGVFNKAISNSVLAGDNAYELVCGYMCDITPTITQGLYINWYDIPNVNLKKPWWSALMTDAFTINDRIYMITGDLALSFWEMMNGVGFNKAVAAAHDLEDMYTVVDEGRWTMEYLETVSKDVSKDLNGDSVWDKSDMYGWASNFSTGIDAMKEAFGLSIVVKDEKGIPKFTVATDKTVEVLERVGAFYKNHSGFMAEGNMDADANNMFIEDRALFLALRMETVSDLREMNTDFGLIPYPKWDETQETYGSTVQDGATVFLVPQTIDDPEFVGIITEAMAAESYKTVVPAYYDVVLKTKSSRDEESARMIDLIRDTVKIDFGYIHSTALNGAGHLFVNQVREGTSNIASAFKSIEKAAQKKLDEIVEFYYRDEE